MRPATFCTLSKPASNIYCLTKQLTFNINHNASNKKNQLYLSKRWCVLIVKN